MIRSHNPRGWVAGCKILTPRSAPSPHMPMPHPVVSGGASADRGREGPGSVYLNQYRTPWWWLQVPEKWRL
ncbi:hypothetical protein GCM10012285_17320 [Streptomyces kronopolitis]|uniref:Trp operon leader peptide n=1 Tax=Streptomyces kronopolitis TaxID=1612435 RepID=A0ABQ2J6I5_9ACTN|nr:hypothetical protein GCM10012285_17320 [Streptomyces kronopolitis]